MLKQVWEVYERDTQRCIIFNDEASARDQKVFDEADIIAQANVDLSKTEIELLQDGHYLWA